MSKSDLLQKCKEMGINCVSKKNKNELIIIIQEKELDQQKERNNDPEKDPEQRNENKLLVVLEQLLNQIPKDKTRKVCKQCNELGHNITSVDCKINIDKNNKLKQKIKKYILSQNCLDEKTIDDHCNDLSILLNITPNLCKSLYNTIPLVELLDRQMDIETYLENINKLSKKCSECNKNIICLQTNTIRIWKNNNLCDTCWSKYSEERKIISEKVKLYKTIQCVICSNIQMNDNERYHYDHLNMFNKDKSICSMINDGTRIEDIYSEINKCQILCLSCHHIVTDIESKLNFIRIKQTLTRSLNQNEITLEEYNTQTIIYQKIYEEKIKDIYIKLKHNNI
jgi:hypothetical protein